MKLSLLPSVLLLALLSGAAAAQTSGASGPQSCADVMLPASVAAKVILGNVTNAQPGQLEDLTFPTPADLVQLKKFRDAPCRAVSLSYMRNAYPHEAALEVANNRILNDLIALKISYGVANRQWVQARQDYLRLSGVIPQQRTQSVPYVVQPYAAQPYLGQPAPSQPTPGSIVTPDERNALDQQGVADSQRLINQNERRNTP